MTMLSSLGACIDFLIIIWGVPSVLWSQRPPGLAGSIWWGCVTFLVALFSIASLFAALALATSTSIGTHVIFLLVVALLIGLIVSIRRGRGPISF